MILFIGSDHAGFCLKEILIRKLSEEMPQLSVEDCGCPSEEMADYPVFGETVARKVVENQGMGIVVCGTGIGIGIAANKVKGARAAMVTDVTAARLARAHNDANIVCIGARLVGEAVAVDIVRTFLSTSFLGARHARRIQQLFEIENRQ